MLNKYNQVFTEVFNVSVESLNDDFNSDSVENWDSVIQLALVDGIEDAFDIMLDTEDILNFTSYTLGKKILVKYEIIL